MYTQPLNAWLSVPCLQMLRCVSRTSLMTKLAPHLAEQLTDIVTDAVLTIKQPEEPLDLYMVRGTHVAAYLLVPSALSSVWHAHNYQKHCHAKQAQVQETDIGGLVQVVLVFVQLSSACTPCPALPVVLAACVARLRSCTCATSWTRTRG